MVEWEAEDLVKKRFSSIALSSSAIPWSLQFNFSAISLHFFEQGVTRHVQQEYLELDGELTLP
jgi:hypothetical protein